MKPKLIADRLSERRQKLGISKLEASRRMHLTQSGYLRYESGERNPTYPIILVMAQVLGTSADYLTGDTDDPKPSSYVVDREEDPVLFRLVRETLAMPKSRKEELLAHVKELKKEKN
ncbi:MAG: helix-turn-helix transcriptional regulator [Lachnospiraceae bacterium]|nr:helix-turn-helix transcriptional regulator [Lachnospiraceae bacterium]